MDRNVILATLIAMGLSACAQPFSEKSGGEQALIVGAGALAAVTIVHAIAATDTLNDLTSN